MRHLATKNRQVSLVLAALLAALAVAGGALRSSGSSEAVSWDSRGPIAPTAPHGHSASVSWDS